MSKEWPEISSGKKTYFVVGLLFMALWLTARSWNVFPLLHPEGYETRLLGPDSYFHLRHSEAVLEDFPKLQRFDNMTAFPHGERGLNQGFYDILIAAISLASFGFLSPLQILTWAAAIFSGVAALMVGFSLMAKGNRSTGLVFFLMLLAYPGVLVQVCAVGEGDHHGFEIFLAACLCLSLAKALDTRSSVSWVLCPALVLYLFFISWAGSPLHLFFTGLCFFAVAFQSYPPEARRPLMAKGVIFGLLTAALPWLTGVLSPDLIAWALVRDVFLVAGLALALGYPILILVAQALSLRKRAALALFVIVSVPLLAQLNETAASSLSAFFAPRETSISEHSRVSLQLLFAYYGPSWLALFLTPLLLLVKGRLSRVAVPLIYGLGLALFWMHTRDFHYYVPIVVAVACAYTLTRLPWRSWTPAIVLLVASCSILPLTQVQQRPWMSYRQAHESLTHTNGLSQAAQWLREVRKQQPAESEYGLLAPWDLGNILAAIGDTPVGWSQTHSVKLAQLLYVVSPETIYQELVEKSAKPFRFVLIPTRNLEDKLATEFTLAGGQASEILEFGPELEWSGRKLQLPMASAGFQLIPLVQLFDGLASNYGHFRLVYESPQQVVRTLRIREDRQNAEFNAIEVTPEEAESLVPMVRLKNQVLETSRGPLVNPRLSPDVRIFEMVPGAVLKGKTEKNARVGAILSISAPYNNLPQLVTWKAYADSEGNFQLRLPYPTDRPMYDIAGTIKVNGKYIVEVGGKQQEVSITEEQVQAGAEVPFVASPSH